FALFFLGYPDQGVAEIKRGIAHSERLKHANSVATALFQLAWLHYIRRDRDAFPDALQQLHEVTKRHGLFIGAFAALFFCHVAGDVDGLKQILAGYRAAGFAMLLPFWASVIADTHAAAGRWSAALAEADDGIREAEAVTSPQFLPELLRLKATALLRQGAIEAAEACFGRAIDLARAQQSRMFELRSLTALGSSLRARGR